eukprot:6183086-Pleurochrysis_carterae.AAC.1
MYRAGRVAGAGLGWNRGAAPLPLRVLSERVATIDHVFDGGGGATDGFQDGFGRANGRGGGAAEGAAGGGREESGGGCLADVLLVAFSAQVRE